MEFFGDFAHDAQSSVLGLSSYLKDPESRRLFELAALGKTGPWGPRLVANFKNLGVLHLLVLSGSQMGHVFRCLSKTIEWLMGRWSRPNWPPWVGRLPAVLGVVGGTVYCQMANWPAPLVRAWLLVLVQCLMGEWIASSWCVVIAFLLHVVFFSTQVGSLGFVLSWSSFLLLVFLDRVFPSQWMRNACLFFLCQLLVLIFGLPSSANPWWWINALIANLFLGWIFETYLFPSLGWVIGGAISVGALCELTLAPSFGVILAAWFSSLTRTILVAANALLYI